MKLIKTLENLQSQNKIQIINENNFKIIKTGVLIKLKKINNEQCEFCNNISKYIIYDNSQNYYMPGSTVCEKCLINSLNDFENNGWEE